MTELHEAKRVRAELEAVQRLLAQVDIGRILAVTQAQSDQQAQIDYLAACLHDNRLVPPMTPGVQAVLARADQKRRTQEHKP